MGPLHGLKIIELASIGPAPFAAMLLADLGATVISIHRATPGSIGIERPIEYQIQFRNRRSLAVDLKSTLGRDLVLALVNEADGLIEGFRPGVTERLGLGPDTCLARRPCLVYGRMTGWGQTGPLSQAAGHDLNYIAITGVLDWMGRSGHPPTPPLNLVGDYGGGGLYLALGMLAAVLEARQSGLGQVVDAAIVDGTASLATTVFGLHAAGLMGARGTNILDGGAPFYDVYRCKDGKYISIAPIEQKFFEDLCRRLEIQPSALGPQNDRVSWPKTKEFLKQVFASKTRDEWCLLLEGTDACFSPVLSAAEAPFHPQLQARNTFVEIQGVQQPAPAPRFSRTVPGLPVPPGIPSQQNQKETLESWLGKEVAKKWVEALRL